MGVPGAVRSISPLPGLPTAFRRSIPLGMPPADTGVHILCSAFLTPVREINLYLPTG